MKKRHAIVFTVFFVFAIAISAVYGIKTDFFKQLYGLIWAERITIRLERFKCERPERNRLESTVFRGLKVVEAEKHDTGCMAFSSFVSEYRLQNRGKESRYILYMWGKEPFYEVLYDEGGKLVRYANCYE